MGLARNVSKIPIRFEILNCIVIVQTVQITAILKFFPFVHVPIKKKKKVFVPIFKNGNHWVLAVIDMEMKDIRYYDSLNGKDIHCPSVSYAITLLLSKQVIILKIVLYTIMSCFILFIFHRNCYLFWS